MLWEQYHDAFATLEAQDKIRRPIIPNDREHNAHMYYLLLPSLESRTKFIASLKNRGVHTVFHYVPLHSSPAGRKFAKTVGSMKHTDDVGDRLVRLPLWPDLGKQQLEVIEAVTDALAHIEPVRVAA